MKKSLFTEFKEESLLNQISFVLMVVLGVHMYGGLLIILSIFLQYFIYYSVEFWEFFYNHFANFTLFVERDK